MSEFYFTNNQILSSAFSQYSKIIQNVAFGIFQVSTNFCPMNIELSGNSVRPQASDFQKGRQLDNFWHFTELFPTLFSVIFKRFVCLKCKIKTFVIEKRTFKWHVWAENVVMTKFLIATLWKWCRCLEAWQLFFCHNPSINWWYSSILYWQGYKCSLVAISAKIDGQDTKRLVECDNWTLKPTRLGA